MRFAGLTTFLISSLYFALSPATGGVRAQDTSSNAETKAPMGSWQVASPMNERREYAGGVRLQDGRILAVSGHPLKGKSIATAELYDPRMGTWSSTGPLRQPRNGGNAATVLRDGRVLLAGGHNNTQVIRGAELYDPATQRWSDTGKLSVARDPVATLLADGRVLAAGGIDWYTGSGKIYDLCELYDPKTGDWTVTGAMHNARNNHRSVRLNDGRVLAVGGYGEGDALLASTELYEPANGRWQMTDELPSQRGWFGLVKLLDGRVLAAGGYTGTSSKRTYLATALIYDPGTGRWKETRPMQSRRAGFSMTVLSDSRVLAAGGVAESGLELKSVEIFDSRAETWSPAAAMNVARRNHRAALLPDGGVLVIGGSNFFGQNYLKSCEIFSLR